MNDAQDEIARLKREVERLRKALGERQQLSAPNLPSLRDNYEFILDCTRYSEDLATEAAVRKKYHLDESTWESLGKDDALVERIEEEKLRRVRDGSLKRERAQQLIVKGPEILDGIMSDTKANAKHRIDAAKVLDTFAANGPQTAADEDRVIITINLGADTKLVFDKAVKPTPADDAKIIDVTPPLLGFAV
jgi:hypothetical protein